MSSAVERAGWVAEQQDLLASRFGGAVVVIDPAAVGDSIAASRPRPSLGQRVTMPRPSIGHRVPALGVASAPRVLSDRELLASWDHPDGDADGLPIETYGAASVVSPEVQRAAAGALCLTCAILGVDSPRLVWLAAVHSNGPAGATFRHSALAGLADRPRAVIGIRADMALADVAETCAHEVFHLSQSGLGNRDQNEAAAREFGLRVRSLLVVSSGSGERVVGVQIDDRCPRGSSLLAGARSDDLLVAPDVDGRRAFWRNHGTDAQPRWTQLG